MIREMFAPEAVSCLSQGRAPYPDEVETMAAKIWRESFSSLRRTDWSEIEPGSRLHASIVAAAVAALGGLASISPDMLKAAF